MAASLPVYIGKLITGDFYRFLISYALEYSETETKPVWLENIDEKVAVFNTFERTILSPRTTIWQLCEPVKLSTNQNAAFICTQTNVLATFLKLTMQMGHQKLILRPKRLGIFIFLTGYISWDTARMC